MPTDQKKKLNDLGFIWDMKVFAWEEGFSALLQFKELKGHCRVSTLLKINGFSFGTWVVSQRKAKDTMPESRKKRLDDLGFIWDVAADAWEKGFSALLQFKKLKGHCRVVDGYKQDGFNLGNWVLTQRSTKDTMPEEPKKRLDDLGFIWGIKKNWEESFSLISNFKEREGHCKVPKNYKINGYNLYHWVIAQRKAEDSMPEDQKKRLDNLGFVWTKRKN